MPMNPRLLVPRATFASPLSIAGCIGWYDSADLSAMAQNSNGTGAVTVGDQVGYWRDKSPTAAHVTQGIGANRPTLTANAVNGRAALVFDGSNDNLFIASGYTAQNGLAGLTQLSVWRSSQSSFHSRTLNSANFNFAGGAIPFSFDQGNSRITSWLSDSQLRSVARGATMPTPDVSYARVYDGTAGTIKIYFNNVEQAITVTTGTLPATTPTGDCRFHIGSNIAVNNFVNGPIAEYLIYNRALSASELKTLHSYMQKKWGVA
jgi:hypothetical protein